MTGKNNTKKLVTGGAGFIGSHLVDNLLQDNQHVVVLDNFSSGKKQNTLKWLDDPRVTLLNVDLKEEQDIQHALVNVDTVFHFAANPDVKLGASDPRTHFKENLQVTFNVLESMRSSEYAKQIVFASTSTVYGDALQIPTPEEYTPMHPISTYGASKLGCEALISAYAHTFNMRGLIVRLANVVGARSNHGIIFDFITKLSQDPTQLEILGDGSQRKSYLYIDDCVAAFLHLTNIFMPSSEPLAIYNLGSLDQVTVNEIASIVMQSLQLHNVKLHYTGGVDGGRGWKGDVKYMQLSIDKLLLTHWKPTYSSREAIKKAAQDLISSS